MAGRYRAYPKYKDTGLEWFGEIPSSWDVSRLKYLANINMGQSPSSEDCNTEGIGLPFLQGNAEFTDIHPAPKQYCKVPRKVATRGEILFSVRAPVGALNIADQSYGIGRGLCAIGVSSNISDVYLKWLILVCKSELDSIATGSTFEAVSAEQVANIVITLPSREEQEAIANFLDHETAKIDILIDKQQQLIKLLKEKRQAVISHAVIKGLNPDAPMKDSGVEWVRYVPAHWSVAKLSFRYEVLLGKMLDDKKITGAHLGKYLRNSDVQWDRINIEDLPEMDFRPEERDRFSVKKGDLLVCEGGEIGRSAIWDKTESCFFQKALHRLRPLDLNRDNTRFMFYVLHDAVHQGRFVSGAGKATIAHLPAETFKQFRFAFPPFQEQRLIAKYLDGIKSKFDLVELKASNQIELLIERRTALISAAVTGKIDVRNWQPAETEIPMEASA